MSILEKLMLEDGVRLLSLGRADGMIAMVRQAKSLAEVWV